MTGTADAATTPRRGAPAAALAAILLTALATRFAAFGNPVANMDDQFYLLVGHDWWRGQLPYIDIWDRKPPGLFALYALLAKAGGGSVLFVQVAATLFAAATAWIVRAIALGFTGPRGALLAALAYLTVIPSLGGQTGQSPVFYNLFMAASALLLFRAAEDPATGGIRRRAMVAMLLCGVAMAIKQVAFVEGAYFGLAFLYLLHRAGQSWGRLAATAAAMLAIALAPTVLGTLAFALAGPGALEAVVRATFLSIFHKTSASALGKLFGLAYFFYATLALLLLAYLGYRDLKRAQPERLARRLLLGWLVAAVGGWIVVPNFFDHYALPLVAPLCVLAAVAFSRPLGAAYAAALALVCLAQGPIVDWSRNRAEIAWYGRLVTAIDGARRVGCLFLVDGPVALYQSVPACRVTRYLFTQHLIFWNEVNAIGTDTAAELRRTLGQRPAVIVTQRSERGKYSAAAKVLVADALRRDYRPIALIPASAPSKLATTVVWQRRDLATPGQR